MQMDQGRLRSTNIGRPWGRVLCGPILWIVSLACANCDQQSNSGTQPQSSRTAWEANARRQAEEYDRQTAVFQRHLEETERQLTQSDRNLREMAAQSKRYDELQNRWISQADRIDALLLRWEKLADAMEQRVQEKP